MLYRYLNGPDSQPGIKAGIAIIAMAIVLAWVSKKLLEDTVRVGWSDGKTPRLKPVTASLLCLGVLAPIGVALSGGFDGIASKVSPAYAQQLETIQNDHGNAYECFTWSADSPSATPCKPEGPEDGLRVAVAGNSHAAILSSGFRDMAAERNWQVQPISLIGCVWFWTDDSSTSCANLLKQQEEVFVGDKPFDVVIVVGGVHTSGTDGIPLKADVIKQRLQQLLATGAEVIVIEDNPWLNDESDLCRMSSSETELLAGKCSQPEAEGYDHVDQLWDISASYPSITRISTRDLFCKDGECPLSLATSLRSMTTATSR